MNERIQKLKSLLDTYSRKIEMEARQLDNIHQELDLTQAKYQEMRRGVGGPQPGLDNDKQAAKHRTVLENRLEQAEKKFGEAISRNKELHAEVDNLSFLRGGYESAHTKLERDLQAKRLDVSNLQEAAASASEAKRLALNQLEALRSEEENEVALSLEDEESLTRCLDGDQMLLQAQAERMGRLLEEEDREEQEPLPGGRLEETAGRTTFSQAVQRLLGAAGISTSPDSRLHLVAYYTRLDAANFAAFNECSVASDKISTMQREIRGLQAEIKQAESQGGVTKQKEVIRATNLKRDQALRRAEVLVEKKSAMERRLNAVGSSVSQLLTTIGGLGQADGSQPMGGRAMIQMLGQLEARSRALLTIWSTVVGTKTSVPATQPLTQPQNVSAVMSRAALEEKEEEEGSDDEVVVPIFSTRLNR